MTPEPHNHFHHLTYIGGHYPYECVHDGCYRRFSELDVAEYDAAHIDDETWFNDCPDHGTEETR